jgi:hypothetical protein
MRKNWPYILMLALVLFVLYKVSERSSEHRVEWKKNFSTYSKDPFGCYVVADYLAEMMDDVKTVDATAYEILSDSAYVNYNYVFINEEFQGFSELDVKQLCSFAARGNTVFVSAAYFGALGDSLKALTGDALFGQVDTAVTVGAMVKAGSQHVQCNLLNPSLHLPQNAVFSQSSVSYAFARVDTANTVALGTDGGDYVNFIRVKFGKGEFILHSFPDAFGNFYAASPATAPYLFRVLSYLPKRPTLIDAHYKAGRIVNEDTRRYLFSEPALRLGYYVLIVTGLIALFFGGRRRQRPVPVFAPPTNSTLEFVEQVGALYYRNGNHSDMIRKKISYFLESLRTRFHLPTNELDERFLERLIALSGVPKEHVRQLFKLINYLGINPASERDLIRLEQLIREFNQQSKR